MYACQRITGHLQVIEFGVEPRVHGVATLARCRESQRDVIDHCRLIVLLVARIARR